jgi:cell division transport system permease protein
VIPFVVFSLRRAWQGFWRNGLMSLAATATMVLMLVLLAGFWVMRTGLLASLEFVEQKVEVVAYLQTNATDSQVTALKTKLESRSDVATVERVTRDQALERFRATMEAQGREDLTRFLEANPLYASLEIKLADPNAVGDITAALQPDEEPIVRSVTDQVALVDRVLTVTGILQTAGTVVLIIVGIIVLFIIVNTIRLAVFARSEEIEIMRLVGASDAFIRWPFVFEGAMVGLLGAIATLVLLVVAADPMSAFMADFFRILPLQFGDLARDTAVLVFAAGLGLGVLGSWLSVRTYLIR